MKRTKIQINMNEFPSRLHEFLKNAVLYDSSSSPEARVIFIDKECGYFLKSARRGTLKAEAELTSYYHRLNLTTEVLCYLSEERDWLLTRRIPGEDCTHFDYLSDPKRLCDTLAERLRTLHNTDPVDCPVKNHTVRYLSTAERNYRAGMYDPFYLPYDLQGISADDAWKAIEAKRHLLHQDTLLHGDYCLPNIILNDWRFSGFIDLGNGGVGDRHVDLFWGAWSLQYNLTTDQYRNRFFDAYGKQDVDFERLRLIGMIEAFG